ncbi:TetR/AcrR family fatty acid metabolism transcriptional regulator [Pedobacter sp. UYP30]|uniref:TetR/AcrR family transcriptional regulator n=1 Tax=Pedobacter sp. UYP30 TaxID=1756400 RepID=UPI003397EE89
MVLEKTDKKTAILAAAEKLFCSGGYEGTSTRQIAKEAGSNMAMINYYFGSKEGVFMDIMTDRIAAFSTILKTISEDEIPAIEKLHRVIESLVDRILSNVPFHKMMNRELSLSLRPEMYIRIKESLRKNMQIIEQILIKGMEDGDFNRIDVRMAIATVMGTITNVITYPAKILSSSSFDIDNPKDKKIIRERLVKHLEDLMTTFLKTTTNEI